MPILTPEERVGTTLGGKYRVERILASGGMGTVFAGVHEWTHRPVAVKVLNYEHARDPEIVRRFLQEARAGARLKHPNVVDVLDMGQEVDGSVYLVLELLEGETLKARMRRGPLAPEELVEVLGPIMRALATAHRKGVVHRDLKPDNIFLAAGENGQCVPKLLDFGIAKVGGATSSATRTGTMVGTPHYMAPEQVRGQRDVGPAADVWSMGVVLYACLAGRLPFEAESTAAVLAKVITERPVPLLAIAPQLPNALGALVDRALQPRAADRFPDMAAMLEALSVAVAPDTAEVGAPPHANGAVRQADVGLEREPTPIAKPRRIAALPLALGAVAVLGAAGAGVFVLVQRAQVAPAHSPEIPFIERSSPSIDVAPLLSHEEPSEPAPVIAPAPDVPPVDGSSRSTVTGDGSSDPAPEPAPVVAGPAERASDVEQPPRPAIEPAGTEPASGRAERRSPRRGPVRGTRGALILR